MKTNELREILKLYGLQHDVVINKVQEDILLS